MDEMNYVQDSIPTQNKWYCRGIRCGGIKLLQNAAQATITHQKATHELLIKQFAESDLPPRVRVVEGRLAEYEILACV